MNLILDLQGFKTSDKIFTPKELAAYDGSVVSHYIFKAPFPFAVLPHHLQQQAVWLMENHHCIDWNEGFTPAYQFPRILRRLVRDAKVIYVKGREKVTYLKKYTATPIIEIEEQPALSPTQPSCMYHSKTLCYCALSNVHTLYNRYVMD